MKRVGVLICAVLALFLISSVNPSMSSIPAAIVDEAQEVSFFTAADGGESSESITLFSETTDDNTFYRPDYWGRDLTDHMDDVTWTGKNLDAQDTLSDNATMVWLTGLSDSWDSMYSNFPDTQEVVKYWNISFAYYTNTSLIDLWLRLADADDLGSVPLWAFEYDSSPTPDTWNSYTVEIDTTTIDDIDCIDFGLDEVNHKYELYIKDLSIWNELDLAQSGYSEPFCSVSDWTEDANCDQTAYSTDGDVLSFEAGNNGGVDYDYLLSDTFSALTGTVYYEARVKINTTDGVPMVRVYNTYPDDYASYIIPDSALNTWVTMKGIVDESQVTRVGFGVITYSGNGAVKIESDYFHVGPPDEMGWAHDGSTTAGVTNDGEAGVTYTTSSDGDKLTLQALRTSGSGTLIVFFYIAYDTTATSIDIERDYYPFFELSYNATLQGGQTYVNAQWCLDGKYYNFPDLVEDGTDRIARINSQAFTLNLASKYVGFYANLAATGRGFIVEMDWVKAYSIVNWTYSGSSVTTDDYLYVDSGVLYSSIDDGYIEMNHDPALSVSDTYPVYNLTTPSTAPEFSQYVSSWSTYSDDTRGATTSGTVTDIKLKFDGTEVLSAIKFIEDGTAPDADIVVSPNPPDDDEQVTLSSIIFDDVEVWKVWYNAISYPTGFSDVDYEATEGQENYWSYSFSSLIAGDYCFKVIANDGANNNTITQSNRDYATVRFTVREAAININPITFIGAGNDFEDVTLSFECNRDGSYSITEWTLADASDAAEMWTGTVIDGWNNIAWDKHTTDSNTVYFNFTITSGSLSWVYENQYQVAQTTFYVSTVTQMVSLDTVTVTGRITKLGAYQVYDDLDVLKDYGSITDLDFKVQFTRWGGYDEQNHDFAIKFTNGSQTCWYNSSFYAFKKPVVAAFQTTDPNILYAFQVSFWTGVMVFFVLLGTVGVELYRKYWK